MFPMKKWLGVLVTAALCAWGAIAIMEDVHAAKLDLMLEVWVDVFVAMGMFLIAWGASTVIVDWRR
jgi:hypothetical protein